MTEEKNSGLMVVKFENHKTPKFVEKKNLKWVMYGEENNYPQYLIELFNRNSEHNAILTAKSSYIYGQGFVSTPAVYAYNKLGSVDSSVEETFRKCAVDFELFNGIAMEVIFNAAGKMLLSHIDFSKIRSSSDGKMFYYCDDWSVSRPENEKSFRAIPAFDGSSKTGKQLYYFKVHRPGMSGNANVYPLPDYVGCIADIETDIEVSNFHFNNIKNQFWGGQLITFANGVPTAEEQKKINKQLTERKTGTDNAGRFVLYFTNGKERGVEITSLQPSDLDKQFEILSKRTQQKIFVGHKVTSPMLFGVKTEGQLGGRTELLDAWEHFKNTYVIPRQEVLLDQFNKFAKLNGLNEEIQIQQFNPIGQLIPLSESTIAGVLTKEELRGYIGDLFGLKLPNLPQPQSNPIPSATFSEQKPDALLSLFDKYGFSANDVEVVKERRVRFASQEEAEASEAEILKSHKFETTLEGGMTSLDKRILNLISKDPLISVEGIAKATKVTLDDVVSSIEKLTELGALKIKEKVNNGAVVLERSLTQDGQNAVKNLPERTTDIFIAYKYKAASGLGADIIDTTRDFCRGLVNKNKLFTRKDIESISAEYGYSVWNLRGGFYHNPKLNETTPYCRHVWVQQIVKKTNG